MPYSFYVGDVEVGESLQSVLRTSRTSTEEVLRIVYQPQARNPSPPRSSGRSPLTHRWPPAVQAVFRVRAATRCTASLQGTAATRLFYMRRPHHQNKQPSLKGTRKPFSSLLSVRMAASWRQEAVMRPCASGTFSRRHPLSPSPDTRIGSFVPYGMMTHRPPFLMHPTQRAEQRAFVTIL